VTAQEEERRRVARELHDQMGQDLTALMLGLKTLRDAAPGESPTHTRLEQVHSLAIKISREVRSLAVHSTTLDDVFVHFTGRDLRDALQAPSVADQRLMFRR